ncbi:hypothetical protein GGX14DRAFT_397163 [Mycena pura]|uniref:Uncharacterized protein n=1 Tax=Mycena pura TaxID=153505 RepID=A0AAD6VGD6_9AGAR|nr:hypothetical protein GGX14DRAFT_397163 [Mycena pura]
MASRTSSRTAAPAKKAPITAMPQRPKPRPRGKALKSIPDTPSDAQAVAQNIPQAPIETPAAPSGMTLRESRAEHPGAPDMAKTKRSSAQVQQDNTQKAEVKRAAAEKRHDGIVNAAHIENRKMEEAKKRTENANHPSTTTTLKVLRTRPAKPAAVVADVEDGMVVDPSSEGPGSSDEYQADGESPSDSDDEPLDPSDNEEPEGKTVTVKGGRPKKSKHDIRLEVQTMRVNLGGAVEKRKVPPEAESQKRKVSKKARKSIGGLRTDWQRGRLSSASLSQSHGSELNDIDLKAVGSDSSILGGIPSDDDTGDERGFMVAQMGKAKEVRKQAASIAGIVDTNEPTLVAPKLRPNVRLHKAKITKQDLPDRHRVFFTHKYAPRLLALQGTRDAWEKLDQVDFIALWNSLSDELQIDTQQEPDLALIVVKLVRGSSPFIDSANTISQSEDKIDSWRHNFATSAVKAWTAVFADKTKHEVIDDVEYFLRGGDTGRVFYYRECINEEGSEGIMYKGLFQSYVCARTLAVHINATSVTDDTAPIGFNETLSSTYPIGALTLSIQALKRVLNHSQSGKIDIPKGALGNFSKNNWGDRIDHVNGVRVLVPTTSKITAVVKKLKPEQWRKIIAAARASAVIRDEAPANEAQIIDVDAMTSSGLDDFDLVDDDSD